MVEKLEGSPEEVRAAAEQIVQVIVPGAKCEVWDYEHRLRCGLVDSDGDKKEFSVLLGGLERDFLEARARELKARLADR